MCVFCLFIFCFPDLESKHYKNEDLTYLIPCYIPRTKNMNYSAPPLSMVSLSMVSINLWSSAVQKY